ncbi:MULTISPECIES: hypothetical protein [unclassified Paenibacillus]|uniref:hypothetical protein n=1 Tax=unclassified Paenibacillus TaxID=185978 RepID=UPI0012E023BA|nr:hypothetical protein [Paenibacillus sp. FSL P4-0081]
MEELEANVESTEIILGVEANPSYVFIFYAEPNGKQQPFESGKCFLLSTEVAGGLTTVFETKLKGTFYLNGLLMIFPITHSF